MINRFSELFAMRDEKMAKAFVKRIVKGWKTYKDAEPFLPKGTLLELFPDDAERHDLIDMSEYSSVIRERCERILFSEWGARSRRRAVQEGLSEAVASIAKAIGCSKQEARMLLQYEVSQHFYQW